MPAATSIAIAAVVVSTAMSYKSYQEQQAAAKQEKKARRVATAVEEARNIAQRRKLAREESIRRAMIRSQSVASGTTGSSGEFGSLSAISTNVGTRVSEFKGESLGNTAIQNYVDRAASYRANAQRWELLANVSGNVAAVAMPKETKKEG